MVVVAVLSALAFAVTPREAHSQQLPGVEALPQPVEEVTGTIAEKPAGIFPSRTEPEEVSPPQMRAGKPLEEAPFAEISAEKPSPVEGPSSGGTPLPGSGPEPGLQDGFVTMPVERAVESMPVVRPESDIQIKLVPGQTGRYELAPSLDAGASTPASRLAPELPDGVEPAIRPDEPKPDVVPSSGVAFERNTTLVSEPALEFEPGSEIVAPASDSTTNSATTRLMPAPVAFEENELVSPDAGEGTAPVFADQRGEGNYVVSSLPGSVSGVAEAAESTAASALDGFAYGPLFQAAAKERGFGDAAFAGLASTVEVEGNSPVSRFPEPESTSVGPDSPMESPLRDMPQPVSPLAPPSGASLLMSGGGGPGPGGLALLLCILVFCLMLSRRGSELLLALHNLPKPSSAPRLPLERPG